MPVVVHLPELHVLAAQVLVAGKDVLLPDRRPGRLFGRRRLLLLALQRQRPRQPVSGARCQPTVDGADAASIVHWNMNGAAMTVNRKRIPELDASAGQAQADARCCMLRQCARLMPCVVHPARCMAQHPWLACAHRLRRTRSHLEEVCSIRPASGACVCQLRRRAVPDQVRVCEQDGILGGLALPRVGPLEVARACMAR